MKPRKPQPGPTDSPAAGSRATRAESRPEAVPKPDPADELALLTFRFSNAEVCALDFTRFGALFGAEVLNAGSRPLRQGLLLAFPGREAESDFLSDPLRAFCCALVGRFPHCAYLLSLKASSLWKLTVALADDVQVLERGLGRTRVRFGSPGVLVGMEKLAQGAGEMAAHLGHPASEADEIADSIRAYFTRCAAWYWNGGD